MQELYKPKNLDPYVKDILLFEGQEENTPHRFPFYADGFPGIIYSESEHSFTLQPANKQLSNFYLYGQTVEPISLEVFGSFRFVVFRLYPFSVNILLGVDPKNLVDGCYDLWDVKNVDTKGTIAQLDKTKDETETVNIVAQYFNDLIKSASFNPNHRVKLATNIILKNRGAVSIKEVRSRLHVPERTFERQFAKEIGVTPKQFAKMVQFSTSLNQITEDDYMLLSDVGYDSGFADQSHFIRTFKRFTGKTPKEFQKQIPA